MTQIHTIHEIPVYEPQKGQYTVHPGGNTNQQYAGLDFRAGNSHDETLRRKTFHFPNSDRIAREVSLKDQGLHGAVKYLRKNGIEKIELATINYNTINGPGAIQVIYAEPPSTILLPREVDVFLHGRNATLGYLAVSAIRSYYNGKAICMLSYRGQEGNKGVPYQEGFADDLDAAIEFLTKHKAWESERINFVASSLGCDVLANMFSRRPTLYGKRDECFGNATLIAPFSSLRDMAELSIGRHRIIPRTIEPTSPGLLYPFRRLIAKLFKNPILSLYDNLDYFSTRIGSVKIFASRGDEYIPIEQTRKVYQRLRELMGNEKVSLKEFPDFNHSELCQSVT